MVKVSVIQQGGDFYITEAGLDEFRVSAPFDVPAGEFFATQRAFAWFCRAADAMGYDPTFTEA